MQDVRGNYSVPLSAGKVSTRKLSSFGHHRYGQTRESPDKSKKSDKSLENRVCVERMKKLG